MQSTDDTLWFEWYLYRENDTVVHSRYFCVGVEMIHDHLITSGFPEKWGAPALDLLLVIKPDKVKDYNAQWFQNIGLL